MQVKGSLVSLQSSENSFYSFLNSIRFCYQLNLSNLYPDHQPWRFAADELTLKRPDMKHRYLILVVASLLFASAAKLFPQSKHSSPDTTWIYDFQSVTDSTFQHLRFQAEYDSANVHITWLKISDQMDNSCQLGSRTIVKE